MPAGEVKRLLAERPKAMGPVPGMLGWLMEHGNQNAYAVILFDKEQRSVFAQY